MPYRRYYKARKTLKPYRKRRFRYKAYLKRNKKTSRWNKKPKRSSSRATPGATITGTSYIKVTELAHRFNVNGWSWNTANNDWRNPLPTFKNGTFFAIAIDPGRIIELNARAGLYSMYKILSCKYVFKKRMLTPLPTCIWSEKFNTVDFGVVFPNTSKQLLPAAPSDEANKFAIQRQAWSYQQTRSKKFDIRAKKIVKPVRNQMMKHVNYQQIGVDSDQELSIPGGRPWMQLTTEKPDDLSFCETVVFLPDVDFEATSDKEGDHDYRAPNVPTFLFKDRCQWDVYAYVSWQVKGRFLNKHYATVPDGEDDVVEQENEEVNDN